MYAHDSPRYTCAFVTKYIKHTKSQLFPNDFIHLYKGKQLVPLTLQYKDFSEWQNTMINNGELDHQKKYWLTRNIIPNKAWRKC